MPAHRINIPGTEETIHYEQKGLPVSQEALFLLEFLGEIYIGTPRNAADFGCGAGLLSLGLAALFPQASVTGYEVQAVLAETAVRNTRFNGLDRRIKIVNADFRQKEKRPADQSLDLVIMNPPFRTPDSGKMSPDDVLRIASHEHHGKLKNFIHSASVALKHKGILAVVMIPERLTELLIYMKKYQSTAFALKCVHHNSRQPASAVLALGRKGGRGGMTVYPPLNIH